MKPRLDRRVEEPPGRRTAARRRKNPRPQMSPQQRPFLPARTGSTRPARVRAVRRGSRSDRSLCRQRPSPSRMRSGEAPGRVRTAGSRIRRRPDSRGEHRMTSVGALANRGRPAFVPQPRSVRRPVPERSSVGLTRPRHRRDGPASSSTSVRERAASTSFVGDSLRGGHRVPRRATATRRSRWRALWSHQPRQGRRASPSRAQSPRPAPREIVQRSSPR